MKKWIAEAYPPKEAGKFARMNCRSQLLFLNKMTHFFLECTAPSGLLKRFIALTKNVILRLDPLNSSCP